MLKIWKNNFQTFFKYINTFYGSKLLQYALFEHAQAKVFSDYRFDRSLTLLKYFNYRLLLRLSNEKKMMILDFVDLFLHVAQKLAYVTYVVY
jgi:hypothetical protein